MWPVTLFATPALPQAIPLALPVPLKPSPFLPLPSASQTAPTTFPITTPPLPPVLSATPPVLHALVPSSTSAAPALLLPSNSTTLPWLPLCTACPRVLPPTTSRPPPNVASACNTASCAPKPQSANYALLASSSTRASVSPSVPLASSPTPSLAPAKPAPTPTVSPVPPTLPSVKNAALPLATSCNLNPAPSVPPPASPLSQTAFSVANSATISLLTVSAKRSAAMESSTPQRMSVMMVILRMEMAALKSAE